LARLANAPGSNNDISLHLGDRRQTRRALASQGKNAEGVGKGGGRVRLRMPSAVDRLLSGLQKKINVLRARPREEGFRPRAYIKSIDILLSNNSYSSFYSSYYYSYILLTIILIFFLYFFFNRYFSIEK
jgi:hypothetical protein